jgi:hypothetical protein
MWISILNIIPSIASLPAPPPGPIPGSNEIVTESLAQNVISEDNQELITE